MKGEEILIQQSVIYAFVFSIILLVILILLLSFAYFKSTKKNKKFIGLIRKRSNFFRNITHEFSTPLTVIIGLNNELRTMKDLSSEEAISFMEAIDRQGSYLLRLVNQLLSMSKLNAGMDNSQWENGNIVSYIEMVVDSFRIYAKEKDQSIYFLCSESIINMDFVPNHLENILKNLISNAIKFSPAKSIIQVSVRRNKTVLKIEVTDQGIGISKEDQKKVFELFFQGSNSSSKNGIGIGLSYTKQLVESMKGKIEVESEEHQGSIFRVLIPIHQNDNVKLHTGNVILTDSTEHFKKSYLHNSQPQKLSLNDRNLKILLIEDNRDAVLYLRTMLANKYDVFAVDDGVEGLELAKNLIPDIIISDIIMPNKDGLMLCKDIKTSTLLNHIPVILLSAKSTVDDRIKGLKYGADAYLMKPFDTNELLANIDSLLENRRLLKEKYMHSILKGDNSSSNDINLSFLQKATEIVYSEMHNPQFSVVTLAEKLSISTSQLNRKLTAIIGYSPSYFIMRLRIEHAKNKLEKNDKPIGIIAEECGYYDVAYFSRTFKKVTNYSPSQYRRIHN